MHSKTVCIKLTSCVLPAILGWEDDEREYAPTPHFPGGGPEGLVTGPLSLQAAYGSIWTHDQHFAAVDSRRARRHSKIEFQGQHIDHSH